MNSLTVSTAMFGIAFFRFATTNETLHLPSTSGMNKFYRGALIMRLHISLALAAALSATPVLATVSISGTVAAGVQSTLGAFVDTNSNSSSAVAPTSTVISTSANASVADGGATNTTNASVTGSWTSANAGNIALAWGWNVNAAGYGSQTIAQTNLAYPSNWQYTFKATGNGMFSGSYNVTASGDKFGFQPLYTTMDWSSGTLGGTFFDPTGSGTFSVALVSGNTYTMSLAEFGNLFAQRGFNANGSASASVDWKIAYATVPEASTWAMLIAGFGLAGVAMRRRATVLAA